LNGTTWAQLCQKIVEEMPKNVYISFDIDGLDPVFCPHTGTPVPGGLSVDLSPDEADDWDGNVGARVLYKFCGGVSFRKKRTSGFTLDALSPRAFS
jgi:agmatinase